MGWKDVGRLSSLSQARVDAHAAFDRIWKEGYMTRGDAYMWLAQERGEVTHMLDLDEAGCADVIARVKAFFGE